MFLHEEHHCEKCKKVVGIGDSFWDDRRQKLLCTDCGAEKQKKLWKVTFFDAAGQQVTHLGPQSVGPVWAVEWKIKPTRWANQAFGPKYTYKIEQATPAEYEAWKEEN